MLDIERDFMDDSNAAERVEERVANAAPEWQAGSLGWRSRGLMEACPLEGLVRREHGQ